MGDGERCVHRIADHVHDPAQGRVTNGHRDGALGIGDRRSADQTFCRVHGDAAHGALAQVLGDFENQRAAVVVGGQSVEDLRQFAVELDVDDSADHLCDFTL